MAQAKHSYLIVGAGLQTEAIAHDLLRQDDTALVTFLERDERALAKVKARFAADAARTIFTVGDATNIGLIDALMMGCDVAIGAARYSLNVGLTEAAIANRCHFVDLGGNNGVVAKQFDMAHLARAAGVRILPDCGVAPGAASVLVRYGLEMLPDATRVRIYCGGLPQQPAGPLKYAVFFHPSGLINEYKEPCEMIRGGKRQVAQTLTEVEEVDFPGVGMLQAAHTSGGASTMVGTFEGMLTELCYKTLRYMPDPGQPGHWDIMRMYRDNGWFEDKWSKFHVNGVDMTPRHALEQFLFQTLPHDQPDLLCLMIRLQNDQGRSVELWTADRKDEANGLSAMQRTTGYSAAICARMLATGEIAGAGTMRHELHVPAKRFVDEWARCGIVVHESHH